jgi:hypothetical protein
MTAALYAAFETGASAVEAARRLRARGVADVRLYAPSRVSGAEEALGLGRPKLLPRLVLGAALLGAAFGYGVQWYTNSFDYPLDVGGRPVHPVAAFVPITFETAVLFGTIAAFVGLFASGGLLRLWRPQFEVAGFERASVDRYWVAAEGAALAGRAEEVRRELEALGATRIEPGEWEP